MNDRLIYRIDGSVAVLSVTGAGDAPAVLDRETRAALMAALDRAEGDDAVRAVVLTGAGRGFFGAVPLEELLEGPGRPTLGALSARIAGLGKPVVAALRGDLRDGALDLALAARARVAVAGTRLAHGAIALGLIPEGGATQTLPRLVGARAALDFLMGGQWVAADAGALGRICDAVVARDVVGAAVARATEEGARPERPSDMPPGFADPLGFQDEIAAWRASAPDTPEAVAMVEAVEAAQLLPLGVGLVREAAVADELRGSARARGLIRAAMLARRAARPATAPLPPAITVLGDGPAALAVAQDLLDAGLTVDLAEQRSGGAALVIRQLEAALDRDVAAGRLTEAAARGARARLGGGAAEARLGAAQLVIEACAAPLPALEGLLRVIGRTAAPGVPVLIGSNTGLLAGRMKALFNATTFGVAWQPGRGARLAELVLPEAPDVAALATVGALMARLRREVIHCAPADGLVVQALRCALFAAAEWCLRHGAAPQEVEAAMAWPRGPLAMMDAEGLAAQGLRLKALGWPGEAGYGGLNAALLARGRAGRKEGQGVFRYDGRAVHPDPAIAPVLAAWRGDTAQRRFEAGEIRRRIWDALCSTGLGVIDARVVAGAGAVDLAAIEALGLPRASGGPMQVGESRGLVALRRELRAWQGEDARLWHGGRALDEAIKLGGRFAL